MFIFHKSHLCQILYGGVKIINFSPKKLKLGDLSKLVFFYNNACVSSTLVCLVPNYIYMCICVPAVYVYFCSYVISVPSNPILLSLHRNFLQAVKYGRQYEGMDRKDKAAHRGSLTCVCLEMSSVPKNLSVKTFSVSGKRCANCRICS